MTKSRGLIVAVLGYGCHLTVEMQMYLDQVVAFINEQKDCVIITSGGFSNRKSAPGVNEAEMMASYMRKRGVSQEIFVDAKARTTNENIEGIVRILREQNLENAEIIIFCNWGHAAKVAIAAWWILGEETRIETCPVIRDWKKTLKQFLVTPLNMFATFIPWLRKLEVRRKEKLAKKAKWGESVSYKRSFGSSFLWDRKRPTQMDRPCSFKLLLV